MKKHLTLFAAILILLVDVGIAQAQQTVYTDGNVRIVQNTDGWQILHGESVVGYGEGVLSIGNLPPAFKDFLDYYADKSISLQKSTLKKSGNTSTVQYGPFLRTAWDQSTPYNNDCPLITYIDRNGEERTARTLAGCSTISSGQIMNYFGYCNTITLNNLKCKHDYTGKDYFRSFTSPYFAENSTTISNFEYTPNFDLIAYDDNEMAKFIVGIGFAQQATFGDSATSTNYQKQLDALTKKFGYTAIRYEDIKSFTDEHLVDALKSAIPVMIDGCEPGELIGHSYIIDGYQDEGIVHIDYGWGGNSNGWFNFGKIDYSQDVAIVVATPPSLVKMQQKPTSLVIKQEGKEDQTFPMVRNDDNVLQYKSKIINLSAGEYEFYFKYDDGTLAPYTTSPISLGGETKSYKKHGYFVANAAKLQVVGGNYDLEFYHDLGKGEISVVLSDGYYTVSGQVVDSDGKSIEGAVVTSSSSVPMPEISNENIGASRLGYPVRSNRIDFVPVKKYITGLGVYVRLKYENDKPGIIQNQGDLHVTLLDNELNEVGHWQYPSSEFNKDNYKYLDMQLNTPVVVETGQRYYIEVKAVGPNDKEKENYYILQALSQGDFIYRVWGSDECFAKTDADGNYTLPVSKYWTGTLHAYYDACIFDDQIITKNVVSSLDEVNFTAYQHDVHGPLTINTLEDDRIVAILDGNYTGENDNKILDDNYYVDEVTLNRQFKKGVYSTIVLPFSTNAGEVFEYGTFYSLKEVVFEDGKWVAKVNDVYDIEANTPYLFEANNDINSLHWDWVDGKWLEKTPDEVTSTSEVDKWTLMGVYYRKTWDVQTPTEYGFAGTNTNTGIKVGDFVRAGKNSSIKPFRCYLKYDGENADLKTKSAIELPESIEVRVVEPDEPEFVDNTSDDIKTPVSEISPISGTKVWSYGRTIFIETAPDTYYTIIDIAGRPLINGKTNSSHEEVVLPGKSGGVVMVMIGAKAFKISY